MDLKVTKCGQKTLLECQDRSYTHLISAGLLMFRIVNGQLEVFLVHPGGPYWEKQDEKCWTIPKGLIEHTPTRPLDKTLLLQDAIREYEEETGLKAIAPFIDLGWVRHRSGKVVFGWAFEGDWDGTPICSNTFIMEWPKGSGQEQEFPECDRGIFSIVSDAEVKIHPAQFNFVQRLLEILRKQGRIE